MAVGNGSEMRQAPASAALPAHPAERWGKRAGEVLQGELTLRSAKGGLNAAITGLQEESPYTEVSACHVNTTHLPPPSTAAGQGVGRKPNTQCFMPTGPGTATAPVQEPGLLRGQEQRAVPAPALPALPPGGPRGSWDFRAAAGGSGFALVPGFPRRARCAARHGVPPSLGHQRHDAPAATSTAATARAAATSLTGALSPGTWEPHRRGHKQKSTDH